MGADENLVVPIWFKVKQFTPSLSGNRSKKSKQSKGPEDQQEADSEMSDADSYPRGRKRARKKTRLKKFVSIH